MNWKKLTNLKNQKKMKFKFSKKNSQNEIELFKKKMGDKSLERKLLGPSTPVTVQTASTGQTDSTV